MLRAQHYRRRSVLADLPNQKVDFLVIALLNLPRIKNIRYAVLVER